MDNLNELLRKAQKGDKDAFGQIYKIYFNKIYRYCRIQLSSEEAAQDTAQETFFKAWKAISTFSNYDGSSIQAYLFRIARNTIIDLSRKKPELSLDNALEVETNDNFEDELNKKEDIEMVQQALLKLEEDDRQIVVLRFFEEMPHEQIAQVTGLNTGTIRVKLHRVLNKLKEIIDGRL